MKQKFLQMSLMMLLAIFVMPSKAMAINVTGGASATIIKALAIEEDSSFKLNFGEIVPGSAGGTVEIGPDGSKNSTSVTHISSNSSEGRFNITGQPDTSYSIAFSQTEVTLINEDSETMEVNSFLSVPSVDDGGQLDAQGDSVISVGATLDIAAGQAIGIYTGTYGITVNY